MLLDPDDATPVRQLALRRPIAVTPATSIFDALNLFQTGRSHMALVSDDAPLLEQCWREDAEVPKHVTILGVVTCEDVMEELIGEEVRARTRVHACMQL